MLFRVRRWIAVMLSLALLPSVSGGARCASHEGGESAVVAEQAQLGAVSSHQHAGHESRNRALHVPTQATAEQAPQDCCPPTSIPGACSSAMGCGVVSAAQAVTGSAALLSRTSVAAASGSVLPPGPSRAPDVPPPRA